MRILFTGNEYRVREYFTFTGRSQGPAGPTLAQLCLAQGQGCSLPRLESEAALHKRTPPRELSRPRCWWKSSLIPDPNGLSLADEPTPQSRHDNHKHTFGKCTARPAYSSLAARKVIVTGLLQKPLPSVDGACDGISLCPKPPPPHPKWPAFCLRKGLPSPNPSASYPANLDPAARICHSTSVRTQ